SSISFLTARSAHPCQSFHDRRLATPRDSGEPRPGRSRGRSVSMCQFAHLYDCPNLTSWSLMWIVPFGWNEFGVTVAHLSCPAGVVELVVVGEAEQDEVVDAGPAAVHPMNNVVGFAPAR